MSKVATLRETMANTTARFASVCLGTPGIVVCYIELDKGIGPASFQKLCNHPQQWFTDVEGRRLRASAIVSFQILTSAEYREARRKR